MFIRQLKYLVTLSEVRHFARAAERCHVSQPALSTAVRNLEKELDLNLVRRGRRYEGLTPEGEKVVGWAQHLLASYEAMRQEAMSAHSNLSGSLTIGVIPTTMPVVPLLTTPCQEEYAGINFTLLSLPMQEITRRLDTCDLDLGVTYLEDASLAGFTVHPLYNERYVLMTRDESVLNGCSQLEWGDVAELPLCLLTGNMRSRVMIDTAFRQAGVTPRIKMETDSIFGLYSQIRCSNLCAVVPHSVLSLIELRQEICVARIVPELSRQIGLVARKQNPYPPMTAAMIQLSHSIDLQSRFDRLIQAV
ncbi:MAG TPA: LysR family transcriptional regulator [Rhodocyclaceae bacterium]|jgi:DNA-binding transcriptional LysR family regulator|nr:LysR family transcriptional regulator [Rhodocyclaceae bacterium]